MTDKKKTKDNHIKVRTSSDERKQITLNAYTLNMTVSDYIRHCCLSDISLTLEYAPLYIKTINLLNDIVHQLDGYTDLDTLAIIKDMILNFFEGVKNDEKHNH